MNIGIILAGGVGSRFGTDIPKQYQKIHGKEVIYYTLSALMGSKNIDKIIAVAQGEQVQRLAKEYNIETVEGGSSRNKSLNKALQYIGSRYECKKIIILEAARPMVTTAIVDSYLALLDEYASVITGQHIVDSLGCYDTHQTDRSKYYLIQAPEAFNFKILRDSFDENSYITATNQQMPEGSKLYINFDFIDNHKITFVQDLAYCEALLGKL